MEQDHWTEHIDEATGGKCCPLMYVTEKQVIADLRV